MIALYWLRSLFRVAPGRTLATAAGIALAVAFAATLAIFVISASYTMTARAIANVPVDWQVELGPGIDRTAVETALDQAGAAKLIRPVEYARVDGFAATTGDTQQVTGPGQAIGIPPDYLTTFPNQVTLSERQLRWTGSVQPDGREPACGGRRRDQRQSARSCADDRAGGRRRGDPERRLAVSSYRRAPRTRAPIAARQHPYPPDSDMAFHLRSSTSREA